MEDSSSRVDRLKEHSEAFLASLGRFVLWDSVAFHVDFQILFLLVTFNTSLNRLSIPKYPNRDYFKAKVYYHLGTWTLRVCLLSSGRVIR